MALPPSGPLSLNDIQTEFGGANPIIITEYNRGGVYVPNTPTNINIPTTIGVSNPASFSNFYNGSAANGATPISAYKPTSTSRTSSTLTADPDLTLSVVGGTWYAVEGLLLMTGSGVTAAEREVKLLWSFAPASATSFISYFNAGDGTSLLGTNVYGQVMSGFAVTLLPYGTSNTNNAFHVINGYVQFSVSTTLTLTWAPNTNGITHQMNANSWIKLWAMN